MAILHGQRDTSFHTLYLLYSYISVQIESGIILILDKMYVPIRIHIYREDHHYVYIHYSYVIQFKIPAANSKSHPPRYAPTATPPSPPPSTIYLLANNPKVFVYGYMSRSCVSGLRLIRFV